MLKAALLSFLLFLAAALISWKAPPPRVPAEPKAAARALTSVVIVRDGTTDRIEAAPTDWRNLKLPTYSLGWTTSSDAKVTRTIGYNHHADHLLCGPDPRLSLGFYHIRAEWRYGLGMAHRLDQGPRTPEAPDTLDASYIQSLSPQLFAQLDSRGHKLSLPVPTVIETNSCWQNGVTLLAYAALLLSLALLLFAAIRRATPAPQD